MGIIWFWGICDGINIWTLCLLELFELLIGSTVLLSTRITISFKLHFSLVTSVRIISRFSPSFFINPIKISLC